MSELLTNAGKGKSLEDLINALASHVADAINRIGDIEYCQEAIKITDARNHIFQDLSNTSSDEEHSVFALRDLCRLDEETMQWQVDKNRLRAVAKDFF